MHVPPFRHGCDTHASVGVLVVDLLVADVDVFVLDDDEAVDVVDVDVDVAVVVVIEVDDDLLVLVVLVVVLVCVLELVLGDVTEVDVLVTTVLQSLPPNPIAQLQLYALLSDCAFGHVTATQTAADSNNDMPSWLLVCSQLIRHGRSHGELPCWYSSATDRQSLFL